MRCCWTAAPARPRRSARPGHGLPTLLIIDTRARHALGDGQYGGRRQACETAAAQLGVRSLRDVVDDPGRLAGWPTWPCAASASTSSPSRAAFCGSPGCSGPVTRRRWAIC